MKYVVIFIACFIACLIMTPLSRRIQKFTSEKWKASLIEMGCCCVIIFIIFFIADMLGFGFGSIDLFEGICTGFNPVLIGFIFYDQKQNNHAFLNQAKRFLTASY